MSTHEWDLFKRLEEIEDITLDLMDKTSKVEPSLSNLAKAHEALIKAHNETRKLAFATMITTFTEIAGRQPKHVRSLKDAIIEMLRCISLDADIIASIERSMTLLCDTFEK